VIQYVNIKPATNNLTGNQLSLPYEPSNLTSEEAVLWGQLILVRKRCRLVVYAVTAG